MAAQLNVSGTINLTQDETFNGNTGTTTAGSGIFANGTIGTINTHGFNLEANNNQFSGIFITNSGQMTINGTGNNTLIANNNTNAGTTVSGIRTIGGSRLNINNMNIEVNGNELYGIWANSGAIINITGNGSNTLKANNTQNATNTNGRGLMSSGSGSELNINNMDIEVIENANAPITTDTGGVINIIGKASRNQMLLKNTGAPTIIAPRGVQVSNMCTINISNMNITSQGNHTFRVNDTGTLNLDNIIAHTYGDYTTFIALGSTYITNSTIWSETYLLNSNLLPEAMNGTLFSTNSTLTGASLIKAGDNLNLDLTDSTWNVLSSSELTGLTANNSTVNLRGLSSANTLTIDTYTASGSTIHLNTFFGGDGTETDKLIIEGSSTGDTLLHINSTGTDETQPDIVVVDQSAVTPGSASAVFTLYGGVVDSGAYEYALNMDTLTNNWYLYSTGVMTGTAEIASSLPADHLSIIKTGMNQLRKRMGDLRDGSPDKKSGVWVRTYAKNLRVSDYVNSSMNLYGIEAGYDYMLYGDCFHKLYAGIMAGYIYTDNIKHRMNNGRRGKSENKTPSFGVYGTWLHKDGWFADATFRQFFSRMESNTHDAQDNLIKFDHNRNFSTGSIEAGRQMRIKATPNAQFVIEPKAELQYAYSGSRGFHTNTGNRLEYDTTQSIHTRAATMFGYNQKLNNMILMPFVEVGIGHEWDGKTDIMYAGSPFKSDLSGTGFDVSLGLNAQLGKGWAAFGDITYENGSVYESFGTNIGVRWNW